MKVLEYSYECQAEVLCEVCETIHVIEFDGEEENPPQFNELLKQALEEEGWVGGKCSSCSDVDFDEEDSDSINNNEDY